LNAHESTGVLDRYVPRVLLRRLLSDSGDAVETHDGTLVFVDVSGFTKLSERLARSGKEGAERLVDVINSCFSELLADAYTNGGSLLKFGGDALLLWFEEDGHVERACASAAAMQNTLRRVGRIDTGGHRVVLRMSVGVHTGPLDMFLVGGSHREFVMAGPTASKVVEMEGVASAGQILISPETAACLPSNCLGSPLGPGVLLARAPAVQPRPSNDLLAHPPDDVVARCLSTVVRAHVLAPESEVPEHRVATMAFILFGNLDSLIEEHGRDVAAQALDQVVRTAQEAADRYEVCFQDSDIAAGGGKLILTAGAPRRVGDDEERMLLALRQVIEADTQLPLRIGVNRGQVFAGEIGPTYRRTYAAMGDTTNLAARLMARAPWGSIYATRGVLDLSKTKFATNAIEPFTVKGKSKPVQAWEVGRVKRAALPASVGHRLPLVGRDEELTVLKGAILDASAGSGSMIELVGETGSGKSRLLSEARALGAELHFVHATCESYRQGVPYVIWRDILRQLLGLGWDDPDEVVVPALTAQIESSGAELAPWLPLLGIAIDAQVPMTREVEELGEDFRTEKLHAVVLDLLAPSLRVPTLLQIEHAHMMDEASAGLLLALAERLAHAPWIVAVTRRDVETGFVAPKTAARLELRPLSTEAARELAETTPEAHFVPAHLLEEAVERAGGSPEFLLDLLAAAAEGSGTLPDSIDAAASARIDALAPGDRMLIRRASVLGLSFHPRRMRHVLDPAVAEPDEQTWKRLGAVFARDPDGEVRFKRPAVCEVAYEGLPFRLRRQLHQAVAEALEPELGHDVDADPAVLSLHFFLAGDNERAWWYAKAGAERAVAKFAQVDAARLYRRAIEAGRHGGASELELAECWEALGEALRQTGHTSAAGDAITAARKLVRDDPLVQARLFLRHVRIALRQGRLAAAVRWAGRGLQVLGTAQESEWRVMRARLLAELAFVRLEQGRLSEAERLCRTAIGQSQADVDQRPLAHASYILDLVLLDLGRPDEAVHSNRALAIYERLGEREEQGHVLNSLAILAQSRWDWDEALRLYGRAAEAYERAGSQGGTAAAACNIGEILSDQGLTAEAGEHLKRARRVGSAHGERGLAAYAAALLGRVAARDGRIDEARQLLSEAAVDLRKLGGNRYLEEVEAVLAEAEALAGDASRALTITDSLLASSRRELPWLQRIRGIALARLGRPEAALNELEQSLAIARERGALYDVASTLDVLRALGAESDEQATERDSVLAQLGIERLPALGLAPTMSELAAASSC
jgi:class 3 adenylate cyclase/tetratricopeptide (TPR) repeat protein